MDTLALIGCGYWGKNYVKTISNMRGLKLKYVYDIGKPSIQLPNEIIFIRNMKLIFDDPEIKGVIVAIPTKKIFGIVKKCLESGKNVLMEKPMTDNSKHAAELNKIASERGLTLMVGHIFVYHPAIQKLKELVDSEKLGKILYVHSSRSAPGPIRNPDEINALWDLAPHDLSILNYLFGKPLEHIEGFSASFLRKDVIDSSSFMLRYGEIPAEVHIRWVDPEKTRKISVIGSKKMVVFDDLAKEKIKVYNLSIHFNDKYTFSDDGAEIIPLSSKSPLEIQCQNFVDCITHKKKPITDGESGKEVVELLEKIERVINNPLPIKPEKMGVPFNDLKRIHDPLKGKLDAAWERVYSNNGFILGKEVDDFEDSFGKYHGFSGKDHVAGVSCGTDAIELILRAWDIGEGDQIITVAHTFNMSLSGIRATGARPVLVDVDEDTYLMNVDKIEKVITSRTRAIMPVHIYGQMVDMKRLKEIADKHNLKILEDACQAHGAKQGDILIGQLGDAAAFSFYPGKNLGAFGDAGAIVSKDKEVIRKAKMMRNYGQSKKYYHDEIGLNKRLHGLQAAILNAKIPYLDSWNEERNRVAKKISGKLLGMGDMKIPKTLGNNKHVYHLYVIQTEKRNELAEFLEKKNIQTGIHYPIPVHLQKAFQYLKIPEGSFPVTEKIAKRILSLPTFPHMTNEEIDYLCDSIKEFYQSN